MERDGIVEFYWGGIKIVMSKDMLYYGPILPEWAWKAVGIWFDTHYCELGLGEYMDRMFGSPPKFTSFVDAENPLSRDQEHDGFTCGCCGEPCFDDFRYNDYYHEEYEELYEPHKRHH